MSHRIEKPWGFEEIITLTDRYCFKKLFLKAGSRTSLQFHKEKQETMYFLEGRALAEIHHPDGTVETHEVGPGMHLAVTPPTIHRVTAIKDTLYVEASTPEMDDVVRLADDYKRN